MVPDVEEIRRELEILVLRDAEVLANGNIPVLLKRSTERVAAEIPETGGSVDSDSRRSANCIGIEELIDPAVNISMSLGGSDGEARIQGCSAGVRAAQGKGRTSAGIDDSEGRSRLKGRDSAERPSRKKSAPTMPSLFARNGKSQS